ncbi:hypothetical protein CVT24_002187 [Panaeolus cyanescens]|uniref:Nucleoporin Nup54 alpha-helical domain-containing protein n=1 Tax=Panaeolus cyanescens TaxID=181874 RepID=A0A409YHZ6_9AGAR|nr:hypothetical protein CVT24_002187 [Panaeolus cyanescens]
MDSTSAFGIKPAGTSIFGTAQPQQQQPATSGFNLSTAPPLGQTQPQQTTSLFSGFGQQNTQQNQQAQPTTSLFGGQQQQQPQQQQPAQGSLFGGGSSSIFGNTANTNTNTTNPQPQQGAFGSSLFGNTAQQPQQQQPSLFGGAQPLQAQATQPASAFGANTGNTGGAFGSFGSSLFANKPQPTQQTASSIFGGGQSAFGATTNQQPAFNASQQPAGPPPFTKSTKFNDLPEDVKKILENIDTHIQGRVQICKDLQQRKLGEEPTKGHEAIKALHKDLVNTATTIRNDLHVTQDLKTKVDQAVEDTIVATRIIDGFRNPQSGNTYLKDHAAFPLEYFTRVSDQLRERLEWYKTTIEVRSLFSYQGNVIELVQQQIERKLASASSSAPSPQSISSTLQAQHASFLALASKTATVDAELQKIKALFSQLWRAKTGSVRDPFNDNLKSNEPAADFGLGNLTVR